MWNLFTYGLEIQIFIQYFVFLSFMKVITYQVAFCSISNVIFNNFDDYFYFYLEISCFKRFKKYSSKNTYITYFAPWMN